MPFKTSRGKLKHKEVKQHKGWVSSLIQIMTVLKIIKIDKYLSIKTSEEPGVV